MDHQVNETEPQERGSRDVPHRARHGLSRSCLGERLLLLSRGIDHRGDWIVAELIARDTRSRLVTINARQQQRSEAVPDHDVLNQLSYRESPMVSAGPMSPQATAVRLVRIPRRRVDQLHPGRIGNHRILGLARTPNPVLASPIE